MSKKRDPFQAVRPKSASVAVGDHELTLTTATLDQESRFLQVIEGLDIDRLIKPLGELITGAQAGVNGGPAFIEVIAENGALIWNAARTVLGSQLAPSIKKGCIALLDSRANLELLTRNGVVDPVSAEEDKETGPDGEYIGSPHVRLFISENITLMQGVTVIGKAWSINQYSELLGNVIAPLTAAQKSE